MIRRAVRTPFPQRSRQDTYPPFHLAAQPPRRMLSPPNEVDVRELAKRRIWVVEVRYRWTLGYLGLHPVACSVETTVRVPLSRNRALHLAST